MKFRRTPQFREDYYSFSEDDRRTIDESFKTVALALQGDVNLYRRHRIQVMRGKSNIWEGHVKQNICFTFHYEYTEEGEKVCFFRRIGTHEVYDKP
jgi:mRNA-degrading endonuclease YafQ of YafQ-DinJ toxin-antitoxin module